MSGKTQAQLRIEQMEAAFPKDETILAWHKDGPVPSRAPLKVLDFMPQGVDAIFARTDALTTTIRTMQGSRILAAASEVKDAIAGGADIADLTVGDFSPTSFRAPEAFLERLVREVEAGQNQYPPSDGLVALREALVEFYRRETHIEWGRDQFVICGGARPPIYAIFTALVGPGDGVMYAVPSWNNDYYTHLAGGVDIPLQTSPETNFFPTIDQIAKDIGRTRLLSISSPLNPTGTVLDRTLLRQICELVVQENARRAATGERRLYFLYDQVYWPLTYGTTYGAAQHTHPLALVPEVAPYTIYVDAISKWMVGTGLRLGWAMVPTYLYNPLRDLVGHIGSWAPRPVQAATAQVLVDPNVLPEYWSELRGLLSGRLTMIHQSVQSMKAAGLPVDSTEPQGGIYASLHFPMPGRDPHQVRRQLLNDAHFAVIPFHAFGDRENYWFRASVGAVSTERLERGLVDVRRVLGNIP